MAGRRLAVLVAFVLLLGGSRAWAGITTTGPTMVPPVKGGTGLDTSASTGYLHILTGAWSVIPTIPFTDLSGSLGCAQLPAFTGDVTNSGCAMTLAATAVTAGAYGSSTQVGTFTVDAKGRLTAAANVTITGAAPGGAAGGDLSGTYPNPTVAKVNAVAYPATPSTNTVPVVTGSNTVTYEAVPNAALANSSVTVTGTASQVTVSGSPVSLGGTVTLSLPATINVNTSGNAATVTTNANLTGDVTSVGNATTLANIPTGTPAVGTILHTNIAAPSSPAAGKVTVYTDSTDLRFHDKNASGTIGTTVVADTGSSNNFLTAISAAGVISKAQPAFSNLSGSATCAQLPALTGGVTTSAGSCATTVITNANLTGPITSVGNATSAAASLFANPSASVGLTIVNGSATTAMRSDGAPALSQAIAPTWTALHTHSMTSGSEVVRMQSTGATGFYGFFPADATFDIKANNNPALRLVAASGSVIIPGSGSVGGLQLGAPTGGDKGAGTINAAAAYYGNGTAGVTCGSGISVLTFRSVNGIVTAC